LKIRLCCDLKTHWKKSLGEIVTCCKWSLVCVDDGQCVRGLLAVVGGRMVWTSPLLLGQGQAGFCLVVSSGGLLWIGVDQRFVEDTRVCQGGQHG